MAEVILYPTETLYALGVNVLDHNALRTLYALKGRDSTKTASWIVPTVPDIEAYAVMPDSAKRLAAHFLPGSLTLVLKAKPEIPSYATAADGTIGFRVSSDPIAMDLANSHLEKHKAPLTCTSANVSGSPTLPTPDEILQQFGPNAIEITNVIDDGPRKGLASTIVKVLVEEIEILREGEISEKEIRAIKM